MDIRERLKRWFKLRFAILYPFSAFLVFFSNSDDNSIMASIGFIITGLLIRLWANGYAVKTERLTTSGPYAFVRHPLYLGTMLIAIGFIIMLKIYYIGALLIILMIIIYSRVIKKEDLMLEKKFKDAYINYKKKVPAILPTIFPYREGEKWSFGFRRLIRSQEYKLFLWVIIAMIAFHLKDEFMIEHETMDTKIWGLLIAIFILSILDLIGELRKRKEEKASLFLYKDY